MFWSIHVHHFGQGAAHVHFRVSVPIVIDQVHGGTTEEGNCRGRGRIKEAQIRAKYAKFP